jgi:hypothetical protein
MRTKAMSNGTSGTTPTPTTPPADREPVHVLHDAGIYFPEDAQRLLKLKRSTLRREIRERRLRVSKRAGRYFILGRWIREWIENGELHR